MVESWLVKGGFQRRRVSAVVRALLIWPASTRFAKNNPRVAWQFNELHPC
jgi:hypothetical protein